MNLTLTPHLERRIAESIDSGLYATDSEVVHEALRFFFEHDGVKRARLEHLDAAIRKGLLQLDNGQGIEGSESKQRLIARFSQSGR